MEENLSDTRRLILHEKAHFLWEYTFDEQPKRIGQNLEVGLKIQRLHRDGQPTILQNLFLPMHI